MSLLSVRYQKKVPAKFETYSCVPRSSMIINQCHLALERKILKSKESSISPFKSFNALSM